MPYDIQPESEQSHVAHFVSSAPPNPFNVVTSIPHAKPSVHTVYADRRCSAMSFGVNELASDRVTHPISPSMSSLIICDCSAFVVASAEGEGTTDFSRRSQVKVRRRFLT